MQDAATDQELIDHLCRTSRLTQSEAERLVREVLAFYAQTPEQFIRRRHQELQSRGLGNQHIFETLQLEVTQRRFKSKPLTTRQIRRAVYG